MSENESPYEPDEPITDYEEEKSWVEWFGDQIEKDFYSDKILKSWISPMMRLVGRAIENKSQIFDELRYTDNIDMFNPNIEMIHYVAVKVRNFIDSDID